ncbi:MAG: sulfate ABC transporter ATP-binding protein, partial [Candidatus Baumannia cicadellinicola]|nr:sulfate ABC transporter ATP-binding protein [Candidatus Baumannia cicadellinicola]
VVVMSNGNIEQIGTPQDVWYEPASRFVLEFMGEVNHLEGEILGSQLFIGPHHWQLKSTISYQGKVDLFLRPWEIEVSKQLSIRCPLLVQTINVSPRGHYWQFTVQPLDWPQNMLTVIISRELPKLPSLGTRFYLGCYNARLYVSNQAISNDNKKIDNLGTMYDLLSKELTK